MKRAYSLLTIKSIDDDLRVITGVATTPTADRIGDIVEPAGAEFDLPIPFLWQHDSWAPIGHVTKAKVTPEGIEVVCELVKVDDVGPLKDRLDEAWQSIKSKLVRGLSIGFKEIEYSRIENTYSYRYIKWLWLELSAVTIPANGDCTIETVKSLDAELRAASGRKQRGVVRLTPPASGKSQPTKKPEEGKAVKISEKIAAFEAKRAANLARILAIHEATDASLDEAQGEEIKGLEAENATIDRDLASLKPLEAALAKGAKPVRTVETGDEEARLAPTPGVSVRTEPKVEKGIRFARYARCLALAHKGHRDVVSVATELYGERDPEILKMVKAAGTAIGALNTTTDSALIGNAGGFADFVEFLRAMTIVGRFGTGNYPALRGIPFRVPIITQPTGSSAWWVGEGDGKPLTKPTFGRTTLAPLKVATIAVATMEVLRDSSPSAERLIRDDLAAAVAERVDLTFIDPAVVAVANVSPASITNAAEAIASTGPAADDIRLDVRSAMQKFIDAKNPLSSGVWIMSSGTALALSMMLNPLGQPEFPGVTMMGGTFQGLPVMTSEYVGDYIVLMNASDVWFADDGGINIDMSTEASLQMVGGDDQGATQNSITPVATSVVSLWQTNSVGFRAERTLDWALRRASAVVIITGVAYGGAVVPS